VSGLLYGGHIVYERIRLRQAPARAAFHVALAAAIGAFGLAVAANIHSLFVETTSTHRLLLRLSLAIWPVMTALPAFVVAFGSSGVLGRVVRDREERP
jgi:hypothetical protein